MLPQYLVFISIFTSFFAGFFYIRGTLQGKTKPNRVSWLIWFIAPITAAIIQFQQGGGISALPVFMAGLIPFFVLLASFKNKNAYWKLGMLDYICLALSLLAFIFWLVFDEGLLATIFAILADAIAFLPTYIKTWKAPETESMSSYISGSFNSALSLATLPTISFITAGFAVYLLFGNLSEIFLIVLRRKNIKKVERIYARPL